MLKSGSEYGVTFHIESRASPGIVQSLLQKNIPATDDKHKYDWSSSGVKDLVSNICAIVKDNEFVDSVNRGFSCHLVLDKTNFFAESDDQASDIGVIMCEDFVFNVTQVYRLDDYIFHEGFVDKGNITCKDRVSMSVNKDHRLSCSQNHTAIHLLSAALQKELSYVFEHFTYAGPKDLLVAFSSKNFLSDEQLKSIEKNVNDCILKKLDVVRTAIPKKSFKDIPPCKQAVFQKCGENIPYIIIKEESKEPHLLVEEPCCGTHVTCTADIGAFVITSSKINKSKDKVIRAVTGECAKDITRNGDLYNKEMVELEEHISSCLEKDQLDYLELWDCMKDVKEAKAYRDGDLPLFLFREHQSKLSELTKRLVEVTDTFVQEGFQKVKAEMAEVLTKNSDKPFIIHLLSSVGDGKKIINYALDNSGNKPAMYFAQDGYKSIICSCHVPKHCVNSSFSALLWINPVASLLNGKSRSLMKDPELYYSVTCLQTDKIHQAISIAKEFIESNLNSCTL